MLAVLNVVCFLLKGFTLRHFMCGSLLEPVPQHDDERQALALLVRSWRRLGGLHKGKCGCSKFPSGLDLPYPVAMCCILLNTCPVTRSLTHLILIFLCCKAQARCHWLTAQLPYCCLSQASDSVGGHANGP